MGVHLTGVHLMGGHLTGVCLMSMHLVGVYLMGVYLMMQSNGVIIGGSYNDLRSRIGGVGPTVRMGRLHRPPLSRTYAQISKLTTLQNFVALNFKRS